MRKVSLVFILILCFSIIGISQKDSSITENQYWQLHFPNGREEGFKYVNLFVGKGKKVSNSFSYFEYNGEFKLAVFDSINFIKEFIFSKDILFESVKRNIKYIQKITKSNKEAYLRNGISEFNDTVHFGKNLAIRLLPLHYNHFKFNDPATIDKINDEEIQIGCMVINQIISFIENKFK